MIPAPPLDGLSRALDATAAVVEGVRPARWADPTPGAGWDVRAVVSHLVAGDRRFAAVLRGEAPDPDAGSLDNDPAGALRASGDDLLDAMGTPGVPEQTFEVPAGRVPGVEMVHLRTIEALVHGWDLARATGQEPRLPDELAESELAFCRGRAAPQVPRTGSSSGPEHAADERAPAIERLVGFLGRSPDAVSSPRS